MRFLGAFIVLTILSAIVWECFAARLYDCTDDGVLPGYFTPGSWVHDLEHQPVAFVPAVAHGRAMSEPDTIRAGWSVAGLMRLWFSFFGVSVLASLFIAWSLSEKPLEQRG